MVKNENGKLGDENLGVKTYGLQNLLITLVDQHTLNQCRKSYFFVYVLAIY